MRHQLPGDTPIVCGRIDFVVERCRGKRVLHLGCVDQGLTETKLADGRLMHSRLAAVASTIWGVDIDAEGLHLLQASGFTNLVQADIEHIDTVPQLRGLTFDVILATEVLEHLDAPGAFLRSARSLFAEDTVLIISVPNAYNFEAIHSMLRNVELVHPDHNYYFSYTTMATLLEKNGYSCLETAVYTWYDPAYSIFRGTFLMLRGLLGWILGRHPRPNIGRWARYVWAVAVRRILLNRSPHLAEGLILVVRPKL